MLLEDRITALFQTGWDLYFQLLIEGAFHPPINEPYDISEDPIYTRLQVWCTQNLSAMPLCDMPAEPRMTKTIAWGGDDPLTAEQIGMLREMEAAERHVRRMFGKG